MPPPRTSAAASHDDRHAPSPRSAQVFNFADYTHEEMAGILRSVAIDKGFTLHDDMTDHGATHSSRDVDKTSI